MRLRNVVFMAVVLVFILTSPAASQPWIDVKDPKDLRTLPSNKTFRGTFWDKPFVEHYRADGKGIWISAEQRLPFTWEVKGDQVRVLYPNRTHNWQFQRNKKNVDEYVRRDPNMAVMQVIKVEDGIPEF